METGQLFTQSQLKEAEQFLMMFQENAQASMSYILYTQIYDLYAVEVKSSKQDPKKSKTRKKVNRVD